MPDLDCDCDIIVFAVDLPRLAGGMRFRVSFPPVQDFDLLGMRTRSSARLSLYRLRCILLVGLQSSLVDVRRIRKKEEPGVSTKRKARGGETAQAELPSSRSMEISPCRRRYIHINDGEAGGG